MVNLAVGTDPGIVDIRSWPPLASRTNAPTRTTEAGDGTRPGQDPRLMPLPLNDVRILALEQYGAGPFGSIHLAELGADVIKIEDPSSAGDVGRYVPPHNGRGDSLF